MLSQAKNTTTACTNNGLTAGFPSVVDKAAVVIFFNSVMVDIDDRTGKARSIERVDREHTLTAG
jgi:calcineurin-like phosphoesterase